MIELANEQLGVAKSKISLFSEKPPDKEQTRGLLTSGTIEPFLNLSYSVQVLKSRFGEETMKYVCEAAKGKVGL